MVTYINHNLTKMCVGVKSIPHSSASIAKMATTHPRQVSLMDSWSVSSKKQALEQDKMSDSGTESECELVDDHLPELSES